MNNLDIEKRYQKVSGQPGIRKDARSGRYEAYKTIKGTRYSQYFDRLIDAKEWRRTFAPFEIRSSSNKVTIAELLVEYKKRHLSLLASSTRAVKLDRLKIFDEIGLVLIEEIEPSYLHRFFRKKMEEAISDSNSKRMNFDQEIKDLKSMLNWYREFYNYKFSIPITKSLKSSCVLKKKSTAKEKMTPHEFLNFLENLNPFYRDLATTQSRLASRISEVAGLQFSNIDFDRKQVMIRSTVVWGRKKEFIELKNNPKNGDERICYMTPDLENILRKRLTAKHDQSDYVFHFEGQPLGYRSIQHAYNLALKKAGLYGRFSGTHIVRHFTAGLTRLVCGNIDAVQAVTGHKSVRLAEHYSGLPLQIQEESISRVEEYLHQEKEKLR